MSDIVAELDRWLAETVNEIYGPTPVMVRRARDEIVALRADLTMARADWNNEIDNRKRARAEQRERDARTAEEQRPSIIHTSIIAAAIRKQGDEP